MTIAHLQKLLLITTKTFKTTLWPEYLQNINIHSIHMAAHFSFECCKWIEIGASLKLMLFYSNSVKKSSTNFLHSETCHTKLPHCVFLMYNKMNLLHDGFSKQFSSWEVFWPQVFRLVHPTTKTTNEGVCVVSWML